jgi:hypothetical protein
MTETEAMLQRARESVRIALKAFKEGQEAFDNYVQGTILDLNPPYAEETTECEAWWDGVDSANKKFAADLGYDIDE